jgi:hypothetical protein
MKSPKYYCQKELLGKVLLLGFILTLLSFGYVEYVDYANCVGFADPDFCTNVPQAGFPFTMLIDQLDMSSPHALGVFSDRKVYTGIFGNILFYTGISYLVLVVTRG